MTKGMPAGCSRDKGTVATLFCYPSLTHGDWFAKLDVYQSLHAQRKTDCKNTDDRGQVRRVQSPFLSAFSRAARVGVHLKRTLL